MSYFWNLFTSQGGFEFPALLALAAVKATLLLAFASLLCLIFRRLSAAARHLLWASALCATLVLPFLSSVKIWEVSILPAHLSILSSNGATAEELPVKDVEPVIAGARVGRDFSGARDAGAGLQTTVESQINAGMLESSAPRAAAIQATLPSRPASLRSQVINWALALWVVGLLLLLFKLLTGFIATRLLTRRAVEFVEPSLNALFSSLLSEVGLKGKVRLLRSKRTSMPVVSGIVRPVVLLPAEAENWTEERRRMVLLHELTHVMRRDCLTQTLAHLSCAFYWFNPLVWYAARRLRVEREQACDDYVLSIGTKPSDYAGHLLDIARSMQERPMFEWSQTTTVAMARRSQLEGRLLSILSKENKHGTASRALTLGLLALLSVLLLSVAAVHPTVTRAQHPTISPADANNEKESGERTLPGSFAAAGASRVSGAAAQEARTKPGGRPGETPATFDGLLEKTLHRAQVEKESGQNIEGEVERSVERENTGAAAHQTGAAAQMPESQSVAAREASLFIKAGHIQEQKPQPRNGSGDFIDEMAAAGYTNLSVDELIRLKTAGVTAEYVRSLRGLGFAGLTPKELASLSIHGVTAGYIQSMRAAGYSDLSAKELTTFRVHNITPEYIKTLREAGYGNLSAKQMTEFAVYAVTPAFISAVSAAGYSNLPPKELVSLRVYAVTPDFIRRARSRLGELTIKQIISLKTMGILDDEKDKEKDKEKNKEKN